MASTTPEVSAKEVLDVFDALKRHRLTGVFLSERLLHRIFVGDIDKKLFAPSIDGVVVVICNGSGLVKLRTISGEKDTEGRLFKHAGYAQTAPRRGSLASPRRIFGHVIDSVEDVMRVSVSVGGFTPLHRKFLKNIIKGVVAYVTLAPECRKDVICQPLIGDYGVMSCLSMKKVCNYITEFFGMGDDVITYTSPDSIMITFRGVRCMFWVSRDEESVWLHHRISPDQSS